MADKHEVYIEASIHGYHAYKDVTVCVGEVMMCKIEENNKYNKHAVVEGQIVGHVPIELSKLFNKFLGDYGELKAKCIGNRYNAGLGKGLGIPVDYKLIGNSQYLSRLWRKLNRKEFACDIRKCQA